MKKIYVLPTIVFAILFATNLQAQTYVNQAATGANNGTSWADAYADLSDALSNSAPNDVIWVAAGTYKPGGMTPSVDTFFTFPHDLSLYGGFAGTEANLSERDWATNETILSGDHNGDDVDDDFTTNKTDNSLHVMWLTDTVTVASTIDGFTVRNGITQDGSGSGNDRRGGAILCYGAPAIRNCHFTQNYGWFGGCVYPRGTGAAGTIIEDCVFENNAGGLGGGIYNLGNGSTVTNCTFTGNQVDSRGGGIYSGVESTYTNCTFEANSSGTSGGAMHVTSPSAGPERLVTLTDCTFSNSNSSFGGAIACYSTFTRSELTNCDFTMNSSGTSGGAYSNAFGATSIFSECDFTGNESRFGAALFSQNDSSTINISKTTFATNSAMDNGGAINMGGDDEPSSSTPLPLLILEDVYLISNLATNQGGAINITNSNSSFTNVLFDTNITTEMDGIGGAISTNTSDSIRANYNFMNCTIVNNFASIGGGISSWAGGDSTVSTVTLQNTILYNAGASNYQIEAGAPILVSNGGNLSTDDTAIGELTGTNDLNETLPMFVDFANEDYHLQDASPCVDKGIATGAPLFDLEGMPRVDEIDMGSFENQKIVSVLNLHPTFGQLAIYPNPVVENTLNFTFESAWRGEIQIQVSDMDGKNIITQTIQKNDRKVLDAVDVKKLPQGMYNLTISNGRLVNTQSFMK